MTITFIISLQHPSIGEAIQSWPNWMLREMCKVTYFSPFSNSSEGSSKVGKTMVEGRRASALWSCCSSDFKGFSSTLFLTGEKLTMKPKVTLCFIVMNLSPFGLPLMGHSIFAVTLDYL